MDQAELIGKILNVKDEKLRDDLLRQVTGGRNQVSSSQQSQILGALEELGLNRSAVREYVSFQTKIGVTIGYLVGYLFAVGGALGVVASLTEVPGFTATSPESGAWLPAVSCLLGVLAITNTNKLSRMLKVPNF
jgi:hypothetical protein